MCIWQELPLNYTDDKTSSHNFINNSMEFTWNLLVHPRLRKRSIWWPSSPNSKIPMQYLTQCHAHSLYHMVITELYHMVITEKCSIYLIVLINWTNTINIFCFWPSQKRTQKHFWYFTFRILIDPTIYHSYGACFKRFWNLIPVISYSINVQI